MQESLNPNHPVTREVSEQWHKLCALLMFKFGYTKVEITTVDIENFTRSARVNIAVHPRVNTITLMLVSDEEGARLAREEGGLPV